MLISADCKAKNQWLVSVSFLRSWLYQKLEFKNRIRKFSSFLMWNVNFGYSSNFLPSLS